MDTSHLQELAALEAVGALSEAEKADFQKLIADAELVLTTIRETRESAAALALALPRSTVPPAIKGRLFEQIGGSPEPASQIQSRPAPAESFSFLQGNSDQGWQEVKVPGASFKLLSTDPQRGYAVALGRLAPNTRYPAHRHRAAEDVYVLSGDLTVNGRGMNAGDFHRAESGTWHDENFSEKGCEILIVLSLEDLAAQMA